MRERVGFVRALSLLADRRFRLLFAAQAVSVLGDQLVPVALAFAVLGLTHSGGDLAFVLLAQSLPTALLIYVGGVWADRLPRRSLMICSHAIGLACYSALGLLLLTGRAQLWHFLVLTGLRGIAGAFSRPAQFGLIPQTVTAEQLQTANALVQTTTNLAGVVGPVVAGVIVATSGASWALLAEAASFAVAIALLASIGPLGAVPVRRGRAIDDFRAGLSYVRQRRWLQVAIASGSLYVFAVLPATTVLGPVIAKQSLGGATAWAAILAAYGTGTVIGSFLSIRVRPQRPLATCYVLSLICGAPTLLLLALPAPAAVIAAAEAANGIASRLFFSLEATLLQEQVPHEALSRVISLHYGTWATLTPLGFAIIGPLSEGIGTPRTLVVAAIAAFASSALPLCLRPVRDLRWSDRTLPPTSPSETEPI